MQSFKQKKRNVNLEPKKLYLSLFRLDFGKGLMQKEGTSNVETKTAYFGLLD